MKILAIDPGSTESGWCVIDRNTRRPLAFGKLENNSLIIRLHENRFYSAEACVIEMVASYGMAVGKDVFETCVWIGRFMESAVMESVAVDRVYRMEEKMILCHDSKAKDSNIRQALIDRFAQHDKDRGKGTKDNPDWFYGFSKDAWMAYAVGTVWLDKQEK